MPVGPFLMASLAMADRRLTHGGTRMINLQSLLPRAFGGVCLGLEPQELGLVRSQLVPRSSMT